MQDDKIVADLCTIQEITNGVVAISQTLKDIPGISEQHFMTLGASARECYFSAKKLHDTLTSLLASVSSSAEDSISSLVSGIISVTQEAMQNTLQSHSDNRSFYEALRKDMRKLYRECVGLDSSSTYFNTLSTNIRITAAGIPSARNMFEAVSGSTKKLSDDIHNASDEMSREVANFLSSQNSLNVRIDKEAYETNKVSNRIIRDLKTAQLELQQITSNSEKKISYIHSNIKEMSDLIGEVVVSVQFHDRMRQRLEHVDEALTDALHCVEHVDDTISKIQFYFILELQIEQIAEIEKELSDMNRSLEKTLKSLIADADSLYDNFRSNSGDKDINEGLSHLSKLLDRQITIQKGSEDSSQEIQTSIEETLNRVDAIKEYLSTIEEWGFQAQFVSLNASVNASKLGTEGSSLAVLSEEIVRQSELLKVAVEKITGIIESVTTVIDNKEFDKSSYSDKIRETFAVLKDKMDVIKESENTSVEAPLKQLRTLLEHSQGDARFLQEFSSNFLGLKDRLCTLRDALRPLLDEQHMDPQNRSAVLQQIFDSYTMEEERQVHQKYFGAIEKDKQKSPSEDVDLFDNDDDVELFDNDDDVELFDDDDVELFNDDDVELFNDDEAEGRNVTIQKDNEKITNDDLPVESSAQEEDPGENEDLFDESKVEETSNDDSDNDDSDDDFGDNIELF